MPQTNDNDDALTSYSFVFVWFTELWKNKNFSHQFHSKIWWWYGTLSEWKCNALLLLLLSPNSNFNEKIAKLLNSDLQLKMLEAIHSFAVFWIFYPEFFGEIKIYRYSSANECVLELLGKKKQEEINVLLHWISQVDRSLIRVYVVLY